MSKVGLLADSHGQTLRTRRAASALLNAGAQILIHLGDIETTQVLDELVAMVPGGKQQVECHIVFGNCDLSDLTELATHARRLGLIVDHPIGRLVFEGKSLYFTHGDEPSLLAKALAQGADYLCHGHTHIAANTRQGKTRIINPGALFRAKAFSAAILDTVADTVTFLAITDS